jgi:peroxiredoxin Q/BCP
LVQLQADLAKIKAAHLQLVAISYDPVEGLAEFSRSEGITFPLLSDPTTQVRDAYGLLNEAAQEFHSATFVVDRGGVVRAKLFHGGRRQGDLSRDLIMAAAAVKP